MVNHSAVMILLARAALVTTDNAIHFTHPPFHDVAGMEGTPTSRNSPSPGSILSAVGGYRFANRDRVSDEIRHDSEPPESEFQQHQSRPSEGELSKTERGKI